MTKHCLKPHEMFQLSNWILTNWDWISKHHPDIPEAAAKAARDLKFHITVPNFRTALKAAGKDKKFPTRKGNRVDKGQIMTTLRIITKQVNSIRLDLDMEPLPGFKELLEELENGN